MLYLDCVKGHEDELFEGYIGIYSVGEFYKLFFEFQIDQKVVKIDNYQLPSFFINEVNATKIKAQSMYNKLHRQKKQVIDDLTKIALISCDRSNCPCRLTYTGNDSTYLLVTQSEFSRAFEISHNDSLHCCRIKTELGLKMILTNKGDFAVFYTGGRTTVQNMINECKECILFSKLNLKNINIQIACIYPAYVYAAMDYTAIQQHELSGYDLASVNLLVVVEAWSRFAYVETLR